MAEKPSVSILNDSCIVNNNDNSINYEHLNASFSSFTDFSSNTLNSMCLRIEIKNIFKLFFFFLRSIISIKIK